MQKGCGWLFPQGHAVAVPRARQTHILAIELSATTRAFYLKSSQRKISSVLHILSYFRVYQFSGASLEGPREGKDERGGVLLGGRPFGFLSVNHRKL